MAVIDIIIKEGVNPGHDRFVFVQVTLANTNIQHRVAVGVCGAALHEGLTRVSAAIIQTGDIADLIAGVAVFHATQADAGA